VISIPIGLDEKHSHVNIMLPKKHHNEFQQLLIVLFELLN